MNEVATHFDPASVQAFQQALNDVEVVGRKSAAQAVQFASIKFVQSGRAASKLSKPRREVEPVPVRPSENRRRAGTIWRIVVKHQNKPDTYFYTDSKSDPRRKIQNRGVAKNAWSGALARMNKAAGKQYANGVGRNLGTAHLRLKGSDPAITIFNNVRYLEKAYPGIGSLAMRKAAAGMQHQLDQKVSRELERAWKR